MRSLDARSAQRVNVVDLESAHEIFLDFYQAAPARLSRLYPDVASTLKSLGESGAQLGICTNKQQAATHAVLENLGIAKYFRAIVGGDIAPFRKPDPRHLLAVLQTLRVSPDESAMVGDNENERRRAWRWRGRHSDALRLSPGPAGNARARRVARLLR